MSAYSTISDRAPRDYRSERFGRSEYLDASSHGERFVRTEYPYTSSERFGRSEYLDPSSEHFEGRSEYSDASKTEQAKRKYSIKKKRSKEDTWKGIFVVTQFWIICFASVAFLAVITATVAKLSDRQTLETKDRVSQSHTWFKFAICLRPFMTDSLMREMYDKHFNRSFSKHVHSLNISDEEKAIFGEKFYLDNTLEPIAYQNYFRYIHPWEDISPFILWEFQNATIRSAFEEFSVNTISLGITTEENITDDTQEGGQVRVEKYSVLPPPQKGNATGHQPVLVGEYLLSPIYLGCLSMTINKEMANKQMDISVKFRPKKMVMRSDRSGRKVRKGARLTSVTRFEAADIFVFNKNESFTEISTVKQNAKFSVMATSRERLLVTSSMFIRQKSKKRNCDTSETNSELDCRQDCIYNGLLDEINCTLPWMERLAEDPSVSQKYARLPKCTDLDAGMMLETSDAQEKFMCNIKIMEKHYVQECLQGCFESCKSSKVRILSLGSKSIGSNYGVTLTVSPAIDVVKEHFNYNFTNMVSELCASVSFLLGLSAIAIYDWLVAFGVWLAARLGIHVPEEGDGDGKGEGKEDGAGEPGAEAAGAETSAKPAGDKEGGADAGAAGAEAGGAGGPEPQTTGKTTPGGIKKRRVSMQLPGDTPEPAEDPAV